MKKNDCLNLTSPLKKSQVMITKGIWIKMWIKLPEEIYKHQCNVNTVLIAGDTILYGFDSFFCATIEYM